MLIKQQLNTQANSLTAMMLVGSHSHIRSFVFVIFVVVSVTMAKKSIYSREENEQYLTEFGQKFRMKRLNLIYEKAQMKLGKDKLRQLQVELKYQDKEELEWKQLKAQGKDKDGLTEAQLRKKLLVILNRFDLHDNFDESSWKSADQDKAHNEAYEEKRLEKAMFKDKKLSKLWNKAAQAGFNDEELKTLKEEFNHHQLKVDEYYQLMNSLDLQRSLDTNDISEFLNREAAKKMPNELTSTDVGDLKQRHRDIKDNYDRLTKMSALGPDSKDFDEAQVQELWKLAQKADFDADELESLKEELKHFEHRIRKLKHLQGDVTLKSSGGHNSWSDHDDIDGQAQRRVKEYAQKVDKFFSHFETRIMARHTEL